MKKSLLKLAFGITALTFGVNSFSQTYTFTNCGATGRFGPTQGQVNATYTGPNTLTGAVTINTQGIQEWTIPATGNYRIEVLGAQAGNANYTGTDGGLGARMIGDFNLTAGNVIKVLAGQEGGSEAAGGGGGGGSYVVTATNTPIIIAGGGGGGNGDGSSRGTFPGQDASISTTGGNSNNYGNPAYGVAAPGAGGGLPSEGGTIGYGGGGGVSGGGGGFFNSGGAGLFSQEGLGFLQGGTGGPGNGTINHGGFGGGGGGATSSGYGGGGGGYSGGGAGGLTPSNTLHGNGGGGGSYNTGTNQSNTAGFNTGHGQVIITLLCSPLTLSVTPSDTVCFGTPVTITGTSLGTGTITWDNGITNGSAFPNNVAGVTTYTSTSTDPNDCVEQVIINVLAALTGSVTTTICNEDTVIVNGTPYYAGNPSGTEVFTNVGPFNCDSTVNVNLTVLAALTGFVSSAICDGDSIIVNGTNYNATNLSGTEVFTNVGPNMCDSTVTVNLTLNTVDVSVTSASPMFTANATTATYQWVDCNNNFAAISGETNASFTATANGDYAVIVTQNGCTDTSACVNVTGVGIETLSFKQVNVFPNPANNVINVNLGDITTAVNFTLTSIDGKVVYQENNVNNSKTAIDISNNAKGVYFLKVETNNQHNIYKVIKQ